jgi:hypothetical protein
MSDAERKPTPLERLGKTSWEDLEAIEVGGRIVFPDVIKRRRSDGKLDEVPVCVRVPRKDERRRARSDAREWARREKIDPEKDPELFEDMDTVCILALCIRERDRPEEQHQTYEVLEKSYDARSLQQVWHRLQVYEDLIDPREVAVDTNAFWGLVLDVARRRDILPLTDTGGPEQHSCIVRMAEEALSSPSGKSYLQSCGISTPGS